MSSTPVRATTRGHHMDPQLAGTPGTVMKKKKKSATPAVAPTAALASTPARKATKKKAANTDSASFSAAHEPMTPAETPQRPLLDRAAPKTPKTKAGASTKKSKRVGAGATPSSKSAATAAVKPQPRLKVSSSGAPVGRLSREDSPTSTAAGGTKASAVTDTQMPMPPAAFSDGTAAAPPLSGGAIALRHTSSPSPGRSLTSPGATSTLSTSSVGVGRRFQPNAYKRVFALTGSYSCLACVPQTAALWVGDADTGAIEIYNSLTGHLTTTIPAPGRDAATSPVAQRASVTSPASSVATLNRQDRLAQSTTSQRSTASMATVSVAGPVAAIGTTPTALRATATHMFIGYSNGTVAVYDFLVLQFITEGRFHSGRVVDLCVLKDGTVVSASDDGALVHWDRESTNFEATTRVLAAEGASEGHMVCIAAATPPSSMQRGNHVTLCGFSSGAILIIDVITGRELQALHGHTQRVLDIAVLGELIFTTAEDGAVLVWSNRVPEMLSPASAFAVAGTGGSRNYSCKLLRRIPVQPVVTAFLADPQSGSLWVAFMDGLLERWSAQPDDDFGVEEVVREGMVRREAGTALGHHPTRLISMGAADTLQVLALSSNGVNKVWYGHHNSLEAHLSASVHALNRVIQQDTEDTAAWRERLNLLRQKEVERKTKYVVILEQLSELRLLLDFFDRWRQYRGVRRVAASHTRQAVLLAQRTDFALTRRYFSQWASFYDWQQRRFRRHLLARALEDATRRSQVSLVFHRWQAGLVQRRLVQSRLQSVRVMQQASEDLLRSKAYYQWRQWVHRRQYRKAHATSSTADASREGDAHTVPSLSSAQMDLLTAKAQRQVLARSMARWQQTIQLNSERRDRGAGQHPTDATTAGAVHTALSRYTALMGRLREECVQRSTLQLWQRWVPIRQRRRALAAVAALRAQQVEYVLLQDFYYRWLRFAYATRLRSTTKEIEVVQQKLRQAEAEHGDIFEKLQLQKRIDQLIQQQTEEEAALAARRASLQSLRQAYAAIQEEADKASPTGASVDARGGGDRASPGAGTETDRESSPPAVEPSSAGGPTAGMMVAHAAYYNRLIDEQRLSPSVLGQMPLPDAIQHVMGQLKANTLNVFTDMTLFRQVKDRRRSGTTAAAIFLEAFSEVKRLVVSSSATASRTTGANSVGHLRWPLCMEVLDCIPMHHCATVLAAIKTLVVSFDLIVADEADRVAGTAEEVVANADWILLIARACYLRRRPLLPNNNRQV